MQSASFVFQEWKNWIFAIGTLRTAATIHTQIKSDKQINARHSKFQLMDQCDML